MSPHEIKELKKGDKVIVNGNIVGEVFAKDHQAVCIMTENKLEPIIVKYENTSLT